MDNSSFQEAVYGSIILGDVTINVAGSPLDLNYVFEFIDNNFDKLLDPITLENFLPVIHYSIFRKSQTGEVVNIGVFLKNLLSQHKDESRELKAVIQIIYQILVAIKPEEIQLFQFKNDDVFDIFIEVLFGNDDKVLNANILACLSLYVSKYNAKRIIYAIWSNLTCKLFIPERAAQIFIHLFDEFVETIDDFHQNEQFVIFIQSLITTRNDREARKSGYFLLKKVAQIILKQTEVESPWGLDYTSILSRFWITYITLLENLEENQSHLILPSLNSIKEIENQNNTLKDWMNILYVKVLNHTNTIVRRWGIEYFLNNWNNLSSEVLYQFLEAANDTSLYNIEGYCLCLDRANNFLKAKLKEFLEAFTTVKWKSVPMHFWLQQLKNHSERVCDIATYSVILKIASSIRMVQNTEIRNDIARIFESMLLTRMSEMSLKEYVNLVEATKLVVDVEKHWTILENRIAHSPQDIETHLFSKEFYQISAKGIAPSESILTKFSNIPKEKHGWLRFFYVFDMTITPMVTNFCSLVYNVNLLDIQNIASLQDVENEFCNKLSWHEDDVPFIKKKSMDFFVRYCLKGLSHINIEQAIETGSHITLFCLSKLLVEEGRMFQNHQSIVSYFVKGLKQYSNYHETSASIALNVLLYSKAMLHSEETSDIARSILAMNASNVHMHRVILENKIPLSIDSYIDGLLFGNPTSGDARIESIYFISCKKTTCDSERIRRIYREECNGMPLLERIELISRLKNLNNELSRKKPRYFLNSYDHRLKIRIVISLLWLSLDSGLMFWNDLLEHNQQLNVTYFYEWLTAEMTSHEEILEKLKQIYHYTSSQQVSIICVTNQFLCKRAMSSHFLDEIVGLLLPLTMGPNFQIRLYSQLTIYNICANTKHIEYQTKWLHLQRAIESTIGEQLVELLQDFRMQFVAHTNKILYITNAPIDEFDAFDDYEEFDNQKKVYIKNIIRIMKKSPTVTEENSDPQNCNIQRKLNPTMESLTQSSLIKYPKFKDSELYVIGSLIEKLPNLGGIARTCEVLGIKNLVVNCKTDIDTIDFKKLSMTAENGLNVVEVKANALFEFLMQKQSRGFKIIGAEQTSNSINFADFKFPKKSILLLGHEKQGIPANLLGLLDFVVEIPQFGLVRCLNVHVTGALFMWEYCKQYIMSN